MQQLANSPRTRIATPAIALGAVAIALAAQFAYTEDAGIDGAWRGFVIAGVLIGAVVLVQGASQPAAAGGAQGIDVPRRVELALLVLIVAVAAFFRFYRLLSFPPGLWFDEGVVGTDAIYIIERDHFTVWQETNYGKATPYLYLVAASIKMFGYTVFAMRIVPAIAGLAAVVAYRLAGATAAWTAGLLVALSPLQVQFGQEARANALLVLL